MLEWAYPPLIPAKAGIQNPPSWPLGPRFRGDERKWSIVMHPVSPHAVKAMLADGEELALIDVREELTYSENHLLWARSVPLSRLELRFARLVPRRSTRIVLCDDADGLAQRAADVLSRAGYTDLAYLEGGVAAWAAAGFE